MSIASVFFLSLSLLLFQIGSIVAYPSLPRPVLQRRHPPLPDNLRVRPLLGPGYDHAVRSLSRQIAFLGYDASEVTPHRSDIVPSLRPLIRQQMLAGPDARQFISLDVNEGRRQHYAMPLTLEDFAHLPTSPALGRYAGTGGKQKILIFSVTHPSPTSLSLFRGPAGEEAPEIVLHGLIGVTHAQSLHRRIALPWFNAHVAVPLRDVLRPV